MAGTLDSLFGGGQSTEDALRQWMATAIDVLEIYGAGGKTSDGTGADAFFANQMQTGLGAWSNQIYTVNVWRTLVNVTGEGILSGIIAGEGGGTGSGAQYEIRVTIDGVTRTFSNSGRGTTSAGRLVIGSFYKVVQTVTTGVSYPGYTTNRIYTGAGDRKLEMIPLGELSNYITFKTDMMVEMRNVGASSGTNWQNNSGAMYRML